MVKREKRKVKVEESEEGEETKEQKGSILMAGESISSIDDDASSGMQRKKKKKNRTQNMEVGDQFAMVLNQEENVDTVEKSDAVKAAELIEPVDGNTVEVSDNIVLRKLLRGPRYFDPPDCGWTRCYNCGEEGHMAVNCTSLVKKRKPCFMCGALDHHGKQCPKGQDCFICKKGGHRAKDCPDKWSSLSKNSIICLKCGELGHDTFSCRNDYSPDDLKEIQCYVCKGFGHLCCVKFVDNSPSVISCYRCGELGHNGLACSRVHKDDTGTATPSLCFKCGEEGHFARKCTSTAKAPKRNYQPTTPTLRARNSKKKLGSKSAPHVLGKTSKKKKVESGERGNKTPKKSKNRGGWITEDPGTKSKENSWRSPSTPSSRGYTFSSVSRGSNALTHPYPSNSRTSYQVGSDYQHRFSASRFGYSGHRYGNPAGTYGNPGGVYGNPGGAFNCPGGTYSHLGGMYGQPGSSHSRPDHCMYGYPSSSPSHHIRMHGNHDPVHGNPGRAFGNGSDSFGNNNNGWMRRDSNWW